jgi:hypothetical protein
MAFALCSCVGSPDDLDLGEHEESIVGGTVVVGNTDAYVNLSGCSGIAIRNRWILSASHCFSEAQLANPGGVNIFQHPGFPSTVATTADLIIRAPSLDVALVRTRDPLVINGSTTGHAVLPYPGSTADLVGQTVRAYGYGPHACDGTYPGVPPGTGAGVRSAQMLAIDAWDSAGVRATTGVPEGTPDKFRMDPVSSSQTPIQGDSGAPIMYTSGSQTYLVGTIHLAAGITPGSTTACLGGWTQAVSVNGFWAWAQHEIARFEFGTAVATGDFDGDGHIDVAVGDPEGGAEGSGRVSVFGWNSAGSLVTKQTLDQAPSALEAGDRFGAALAAGDLDGDGRDDLVVGLPGEEPGGNGTSAGTGYIHLYRGTASGLVFVRNYGQRSPESDEGGDHFGATLALGDFDDDGDLDIAVGSPTERHTTMTSPSGATLSQPQDITSGAVFILTCDGTSSMVCAQSWILRKPTPWIWDQFGASLAAGDFDGDGDDDLAVGAPAALSPLALSSGTSYRSTGNAYVFWNDNGLSGVCSPVAQPGLIEEGDNYGYSVAAGDFIPGGGDDLAIGAPGEAPWGGATRTGWVYVWRGTWAGLAFENGFGQDPVAANERDDFFGAVMWGGRLTSSGTERLAVSAPLEVTAPNVSAGRVFLASWTGSAVAPYAMLGQHLATASTDENGDFYGGSFAGIFGRRYATDANRHHLMIGVPGEHNGSPLKGAVHGTAPAYSGGNNLYWIWGP